MNLQRLRFLINRLPMARFRVEKAMSRATKVTSTLSDMPRGGMDGDRMTDNVILLQTAKETYRNIKAEIKQLQGELQPMIEKLDDPLERTCLQMRYMDGYSAREIAYKLNYSERHIFRALKTAEKRIDPPLQF